MAVELSTGPRLLRQPASVQAHPALAAYVASIEVVAHQGTGPPLRSLLFPEATVDLAFSCGPPPELHADDAVAPLAPASLLGLSATTSTFALRGPLWGLKVSLRPLGALALFGSPRELQVPHAPLDALTNARLARAVEELSHLPEAARVARLQQLLLAALNPHATLHPDVAAALNRIHHTHGALSITALAGELHISRRHLERRFLGEVGLTPKQYARHVRFARARLLIDRPSAPGGAELAAALGYSDQAHFIAEFRAFAQLTPSAYRRMRRPAAE